MRQHLPNTCQHGYFAAWRRICHSQEKAYISNITFKRWYMMNLRKTWCQISNNDNWWRASLLYAFVTAYGADKGLAQWRIILHPLLWLFKSILRWKHARFDIYVKQRDSQAKHLHTEYQLIVILNYTMVDLSNTLFILWTVVVVSCYSFDDSSTPMLKRISKLDRHQATNSLVCYIYKKR